MNSFGKFLRLERVKAGLSLRKTAQELGVSHVYLGEVERGVRAPLARDRWPRLMAVIPAISADQLARLDAEVRPVKLRVAEAPPAYQDLALAFARRIENQDLGSEDLQRIWKILRGEGEDE